jgi:hypothetical protein
MLTVHAITGLLEIDKAAERMLGVQSSFWVAVALTYLDFLEDRQVSDDPPLEKTFLLTTFLELSRGYERLNYHKAVHRAV